MREAHPASGFADVDDDAPFATMRLGSYPARAKPSTLSADPVAIAGRPVLR